MTAGRDGCRRAMAADAVDQRRRAEHVGDAELLDRGDDIHRIHLRGPGRVHLRNYRRHAERRAEQGEQRKGRQVQFARLDAVEPADVSHLRAEYLVRIDRAFRRAGAAAREKYGGGLAGRRLDRVEWLTGRDPVAQLLECMAAPEPPRAHRDIDA